MKLYYVYDNKAKAVSCVFMSASDEQARRSFEDLITAPEDSVFSLHPEDFSLMSIEIDLDSAAEVVLGSSYSRSILESDRLKRQEYLSERRKISDLKHSEFLEQLRIKFKEEV